MINGQNIICISSIDWDFIWQGHQEVMSAFASGGNRVLFIENTGVRAPGIRDIPRLGKRILSWIRSSKGFRRQADNLFIFSPVALPLPYSKIARSINRFLLLGAIKKWIRKNDFSDPIIWTFLPTGLAIDIIDNIPRKALVYYCIADFNYLVSDPKKIRASEDELIKRCDLIFVQGKVLQKRCLRYNNNVHIYPFGVNLEVFEGFDASRSGTPSDIEALRSPIIGYIGGVHKHVDLDLIKFLANKHADWSFVLIGPAQTDVSKIASLKNVFLLGKKDFKELPAYINRFDICIIPYVISDYTNTVFPTKMNEYHAMGKPVVSTPLPEVIDFNKDNGNLVFIGDGMDDFDYKIKLAMDARQEGIAAKRISSTKRHGWAKRIEDMADALQAVIDQKGRV